MDLFFSIITVSYNSEKTIRKTIESVLKQNFISYEYIIVDGGSIDGTLDIIRESEHRFEGKLQYISERDKGIYDAMNKGVKISKGKYIWLVNSDDYLEPNILSWLSNEYMNNQWGNVIVCGNLNIVNPLGKIVEVSHSSKWLHEKSINHYSVGVNHPTTIIPRSIYSKEGLYNTDYYIMADVDLLLRYSLNGVKFRFIDKILSNMLNTGVSNSLNIDKYIHDWKIFYRTFTSNYVEYLYYIIRSLSILCMRKIIPYKLYKYILKIRHSKI